MASEKPSPWDNSRYFVALPLAWDFYVEAGKLWVKLLGPFDDKQVAQSNLQKLTKRADEFNIRPSQLRVITRKSIQAGVLEKYINKGAQNA